MAIDKRRKRIALPAMLLACAAAALFTVLPAYANAAPGVTKATGELSYVELAQLRARQRIAAQNPENFRSTEDLLNEMIPTVQEDGAPESDDASDMQHYEPQVGDVLFRIGLSEMSQWYGWFFNEEYTHSAIVTQVEPEVQVTHCTKDRYINGVNTVPLVNWALKSKGIEVHRLKNHDPEIIAELMQSIEKMKEEGVMFDASWNFHLSEPQEGRIRRMYCTVFVWQSFRSVGIDLCPQKHGETNPLRRAMLWLAGVRKNFSFVTVDKLRHSDQLVKIAEFAPNVFRVNERVRLRTSGASFIGDYNLPQDMERVDDKDSGGLIPTYRDNETRFVMRPNPMRQLRELRGTNTQPLSLKGLKVEQRWVEYDAVTLNPATDDVEDNPSTTDQQGAQDSTQAPPQTQ
ncbi:hypothetical protein JXA32_08385 [Candidatus Sumerlaeota bacterium]|nr:hypothetical protein [Candidatus Sumerlaeota bacterium]